MFALYTGVVSRMCSEISDYKQPGFADIPRFLKESYGSSLILAVALAAYAFVVSVAFQFYGGHEDRLPARWPSRSCSG